MRIATSNICKIALKSIFLSLFIVLYYCSASAADSLYLDNINIISDKLIESPHNQGNYEIHQIIFVGNKHYSHTELADYISSQPTDMSIPNQILSTYHNQSKKNTNFPRIYVEELGRSIAQFNNEYHYFNSDIATNDVQILTNLYNTNGFHFAQIKYSFGISNHRNTLTFYIKENPQYTLSSKIYYSGLEDLPNDAKTRIDNVIQVKAGDPFSEEKIETEIKNVHSALTRNGYMYAKWDYPFVTMDTVNHTDSVVAYFKLGNRIKIGSITFVDSTNNQQNVANTSKRKFIRIAEGDYFNARRVDLSVENLLSSGVFESVSIDTIVKDYTNNDSTRDFVITSKYRGLRDWDAGLSINRTKVDQLINAGIEGFLLHRNLFGSAQSTKLYSNVFLKDFNRFLSTWDFPDFEFKIGASYAQPILWQIENSRVSLSASLEYSLEILNGLFKISQISFPVSFPVRLPWTNYFSNLNFELEINREVPLNYSEVESFALDSANTTQDSNNVLSALMLYRRIDDYLHEPDLHIFTSNLLSISLTGDSRNHPFTPTTGSLTYLGLDGFNFIFFPSAISGVAKYIRLQAEHKHFWQLSRILVLGIKGKMGYTYLFNGDNYFVPQDRQFFAGGANSVRAWNARQLRFSNQLSNIADGTIGDFSKNYIGSRSLLEGSIEIRRKLSDLPGIAENLKWIINDMGIGVFLDFGNAFGWYSEDNDTKTNFKLADYFTKLAVGTGIGLRYETPIGPIRVDVATPLFDPMHKRNAFGDVVVVFAIGHAF